MTSGGEIAEILRLRMANQGLSIRTAGGDPVAGGGSSVREATLRSAGIQAQDLWASRLAVRARSCDAALDDVITAAQAPPTVVRSWLMRGTLHMVAADDLHWLVELFGPVIEAQFHRRHAELGLTPDLLDRIADALPTVLRGTALTRAALAAALIEVGVPVPMVQQGPTHLTVWASVRGLICRGAEIGSEPTYVLLDDWIPALAQRSRDKGLLAGDQAVIEVARRYLRAFGPASVHDLAAWSRLPMGRIRPALATLAGEVQTCSIEGKEHFLYESPSTQMPLPTGVLRLLPAFDSYVMGYQRRHLFLDPARHTDILEGGMIQPMIVLDGVIIGTWRLNRAKEPAVITAEIFDTTMDPMRSIPGGENGRRRAIEALHEEVADVGRFLGRDTTLLLADRIRSRRPSPSRAVPS